MDRQETSLVAIEVVLGTGVIFCNCVAIVVFWRCRQIFVQLKLILLVITAHSCLCGVVCLLLAIYQKVLGYNSFICVSLFIAWTGFRIVPVALTTLLDVDRFISVTWSIWYQRKVTKQRTLITCLAVTLFVYITVALSYSDEAFQQFGRCSRPLIQMNDFGVGAQILILFASVLLSTVSYSAIFYESKRYMSTSHINTTDMSRLYETFRMSFLICGVTITFYVISVTTFVVTVVHLQDGENTGLDTLHLICCVLLIVVVSLNPIFYIVRFRESRFQLMKIICLCNTTFRERVEGIESQMRLDIAGIPVPLSTPRGATPVKRQPSGSDPSTQSTSSDSASAMRQPPESDPSTQSASHDSASIMRLPSGSDPSTQSASRGSASITTQLSGRHPSTLSEACDSTFALRQPPGNDHSTLSTPRDSTSAVKQPPGSDLSTLSTPRDLASAVKQPPGSDLSTHLTSRRSDSAVIQKYSSDPYTALRQSPGSDLSTLSAQRDSASAVRQLSGSELSTQLTSRRSASPMIQKYSNDPYTLSILGGMGLIIKDSQKAVWIRPRDNHQLLIPPRDSKQ